MIFLLSKITRLYSDTDDDNGVEVIEHIAVQLRANMSKEELKKFMVWSYNDLNLLCT
jgi:hypothetical protein